MFEKIKRLFVTKSTPMEMQEVSNSINNTGGTARRANAVYGEDRMSRQKLYEKWVCKESWHLKNEAIPLLLGIDPANQDAANDDLQQQTNELWQHANECVIKKMLAVVNNEAPADEWHVTPADIYCWATVGRISLPEELSALMEFVLQTVKSTTVVASEKTAQGERSDEDALYQKHREITLGAAVAFLVNNPELCKTSRGKVRAALIAAEINKGADAWFGKDEPRLAVSAMSDLIDNYIARARLPVSQSGN